MIEQFSTGSDEVLAFKLSGRLHHEDYEIFAPSVENAIKTKGKIRLLAQFHDFHGWDAHALWDDVKFAAEHFRDAERIALVGEKKWEEWMARVCKPFTTAKVKYFDAAEVELARAWLQESA